MIILVWEYLYYLAHMLAGLSFLVMTVLFGGMYAMEHRLKTPWRVFGFLLLGLAFLLYVVQRIWRIDSQGVAFTELLAMGCLLFGVYVEPNLTHLLGKSDQLEKVATRWKNPRVWRIVIWGVGLCGTALVVGGALTWWNAIPSFYFIAAAAIVSALLLSLAVMRLRRERAMTQFNSTKVNAYFLFVIALLLFRQLTWLIHNWPFATNWVWINHQILDYSQMWLFNGVVTALIGVGLIVTMMPFLRTRTTQRVRFSFVMFNILIASASAVIFSFMLLSIVEQNQLAIVQQQTRVQKLIIDEGLRSGQILASTLATSSDAQNDVNKRDYSALQKLVDIQVGANKPDQIRLYNKYGEIVWSYLTPSEVSTVASDDQFVVYSLHEQRSLQTLSTVSGVLAPQLVGRSFYPVLLNNQETIGLIEVQYVYDNAFVDSVKKRTGSDVTIIVGSVRAATTLTTADGVSRWVGSRETNKAVLSKVLDKGQEAVTSLYQLGRYYYAGYLPLSNVNNERIAMISILNSAAEVIEQTRQRLVLTYLIITNASLVGTAVLYLIIKPYLKRNRK